jgi:hypothetical protein
LELEYAQARRSKILNPARNKGNGEMLGVNGHVRDGNVSMWNTNMKNGNLA